MTVTPQTHCLVCNEPSEWALCDQCAAPENERGYNPVLPVRTYQANVAFVRAEPERLMSEVREFQDWTWEQLHACYANWNRTYISLQEQMDTTDVWLQRLNAEYDARAKESCP